MKVFNAFLKTVRSGFDFLLRRYAVDQSKAIVGAPFNIGNLIADAIGVCFLGVAIAAMESQRGEMRNVDRYPRFFSLRLDRFHYAKCRRAGRIPYMRQGERRSLKSLGFRILAS